MSKAKRKESNCIECTQCHRTADMRDPATCSGWTILPVVVCSTCNGRDSAPFYEIPAQEKGKVIRIPQRAGG